MLPCMLMVRPTACTFHIMNKQYLNFMLADFVMIDAQHYKALTGSNRNYCINMSAIILNL